jgi:hypothetical protein
MVHKVVMPTSSGGTYKVSNMKRLSGDGLKLGKGNGSFLLDGGMGGQSSYASLDAYTHTTGQNPITRKSVLNPSGNGLEKLSSKISGLSIQPKKKRQNIKFEL